MEFDDDPTNLDEISVLDESDTAKHKSIDYLAGREKGFGEGVEAAVKALEVELIKTNITGKECQKILNRVRTGGLERG